MAKYTVNYKCGHDGTVRLYGKTSERESELEWMSRTMLCADCYKAEQERQNVQAGMDNIAAGLPMLTGSEKQIAWAESLRKKAYDLFLTDDAAVELLIVALRKEHGLTEEIIKAAGLKNRQDAIALMLSIIRKHFGSMVKASAWIDSRPMGSRGYVNVWEYCDLSDTLVALFVEAVKAAPQPAAVKSVRMSLSAIMRRAWQIARDAAKEIGCALREIVFGECLKLAWAEARA